MTQNNDEQKKQPWESSFTEETSADESAAPSRTQFRKRSSRTAWIVSLLILAVVVLAAYPVVRYVESINSPGSSADEPTQTQISTSTPSKSKESADKSEKSDKAAKDEQSKADASSKAAASASADASSQAAASLAAASSAASSQAAAQSAQAASTKAAQEQAKKDAASSSSKADASSSSSSQAGGQFDTVKVNGYRLALAHGLSLAQLQALNPGVDLNNVHVGESLRVSN